MLEAAVAFPVLLMVAIGLVQFALFAHAQNVVTGAVQDGARVAAQLEGVERRLKKEINGKDGKRCGEQTRIFTRAPGSYGNGS